jgi:predicted DNA binding CopG/RHH family protein
MNSTTTLQTGGTGIFRHFTLALLVLAGLCLTGCGNKMAIMQENQANLQMLVGENARQMSDLVASMKQNQQALKVSIQSLRDTTQELSGDITQVTVAHADLKKTVQQDNAVMISRVAQVEAGQEALIHDLSKGTENRKILAASIGNEQEQRLALGQEVQDNKTLTLSTLSTLQGSQVALESELKSLKVTIQDAVVGISALAVAQQSLELSLNDTVAGPVATLQETQTQQQTQLDYSQDQIDKLITGLTGLQTNLTQLEGILKEDIENMSKAVELSSQQVQGENGLTQQVSELQSSTHSMIDALKEELQDVRIVVADIKAIRMKDVEIISSEESTP